MAINKVNYGNETLIDISSDDVTENDVLELVTFHKSDGTVARGSIKNNGISSISAKSSEIPINIPLYGFYDEGSNVLVQAIETQQKSIEISSPAVEYVFPDEGKYLESVEVTPSTTEITVASGNRDEIIEGELYSKITVLAKEPIVLQEKTATPTTSEQEVTADAGAYLGKVTVKAVTCNLPSADKIAEGEVASVTSNGTTLASVTGTMPLNDIEYASDTFTISASGGTVIVNCGFKPDKIIIYRALTNTPNIVCLYDKDISTTQFYQNSGSTNRWLNLQSAVASIVSVSDTGFDFRGYNSANVQYKYVAIKGSPNMPKSRIPEVIER